MATRMALQIPIERGHQFAAFADAQGLNHGEAIGALLDHAAKTGLTVALALPGTEIDAQGDYIEIKLDGCALSPLTVSQARSFAAELQRVATMPGAAVLDMDTPDIIEISRRGAGVMVAVTDREAPRRQTFASRPRLFTRRYQGAC